MAFDAAFILVIQEIQDEEQRSELRLLKKHLRDANNPFSLPENVFKGIFRLSRQLVGDIIIELSPHLPEIRKPQISVTNAHKILATFHFLGHGGYQKSIAQNFITPISQQALSIYIKVVCSAVVEHFGHMIKFPTTAVEKENKKEEFLDIGGFPGIIGAIDCTHIAIQAPPFNNEETPGMVFLNRKGFYSINTQIIVDARLKILGICARFPGSVHDSAIWGQSLVKRHLEQLYMEGNHNSWLIGDSGYPLQPFLLTPVGGNNLTIHEMNFNRVHKSVRNIIERLNGVLKTRFRCCLRHRTLHYSPITAAKIIHTCAILHNICMDRGEALEDYEQHNDVFHNNDNNEPQGIGRKWLNEGRQIRQRVINTYF